MKQDNRETMHRAIGIIEGTMYGAAERIQDALTLAVEMLDNVLSDEEKNDETRKLF
jgi:hypothetical protein